MDRKYPNSHIVRVYLNPPGLTQTSIRESDIPCDVYPISNPYYFTVEDNGASYVVYSEAKDAYIYYPATTVHHVEVIRLPKNKNDGDESEGDDTSFEPFDFLNDEEWVREMREIVRDDTSGGTSGGTF